MYIYIDIMIYPPITSQQLAFPALMARRMMTSASLPVITERIASACPGRRELMDQRCPQQWMECFEKTKKIWMSNL